MIRSLILSLAAGLALSSCGVNVDLSSLTFDSGAEADTRAVLDVPVPADASGIELQPGDGTGAPDVVGPPGCWEVYQCLAKEEMAWDLAQNKFLKCGATLEDGKYPEAIQGLHDCLDTCVISDTANEFGMCLFANCINQTITCINDEGGDKECSEAMQCSTHDCSGLSEGTSIEDAFCLLDCFSGLEGEQLDRLVGIVDECFEEEEGLNPGCVPALQTCYAGSGEANKSCWDLISCTQTCPQCADPLPEPVDGECSQKQQQCTFDCYVGMSMDAYDQLMGFSECYLDPKANAFTCLDSALLCFEESLGAQPGTLSCAASLSIVQDGYYMPDNVEHTKKFEVMMGAFWALNKNYKAIMHQTLKCLGKKWDVFPGYGAMQLQHWTECAVNFCP